MTLRLLAAIAIAIGGCAAGAIHRYPVDASTPGRPPKPMLSGTIIFSKSVRDGIQMAANKRSAWIFGGALLIAASTLAGCASMPLADSKSAEKAGTSQDPDDSKTPSWPADVWHSIRNAMGAVYDAGISFNPLMISRK